jgi:hypothetical protein
MPTKTEAIKNFLEVKAKPHLAKLYSLEMECQVNVGQDGGERIDGEFKGRKWHGWTDGLTTWKSFRIPYRSNSEPVFDDGSLNWDLAEHAEGIGMTGWNWTKKLSLWLGYDFDAILGHSEKHKAKLTNDQLEAVKEAAQKIDWVTIGRSSSGKGLHIYVFLEGVETSNHDEHAALARAVLGKLSALVGFDFTSKVDICGGNMWVWHRKCVGNNGFELLKQGSIMPNSEVPANWREHIKVVTRKRRKNLPQDINALTPLEELSGQHPHIELDEEHKKLVSWLKEQNALWWWDQDNRMLVTHTMWLKRAFEALKMRGFYNTNSDGSNLNEQNCFMYPIRKGAWSVRRYSQGVQEHASWEQDGAGWTRCYFNREADLGSAARAHGGLEDPAGGFCFRTAQQASQAALLVGVKLGIGPTQAGRDCKLKQHKDGRLIVEITHEPHDRGDEMSEWLAKKGKWVRLFSSQLRPDEPEVGNYDDLIRHLVNDSGEDSGWMLRSDNQWRDEPLAHAKVAMGSLNYSDIEVKQILGSSIFKPWRIVNKPFQSEYPGGREWNRKAAQFRFEPTRDRDELLYPTWTKVLNHSGAGLDEAIKSNTWAKTNGILNGGDYLKCWLASVFQEPLEPTPYLFFWSIEQDTGKSIFHEMINLLLTAGYVRADLALTSASGFNAELEGAILCVVEETDIHKSKVAYNRIKDWVNSREIMLHGKGKTPYHVLNSTHWVQCGQTHIACPVFPGDTRVTMCHVSPIDPLKLIIKKQLIPMLEKEAPDFVAELLRLEIPPSVDRLNIPVIATSDKEIAQNTNLTALDTFLQENCFPILGAKIRFSDFHIKFSEWAEQHGEPAWSKIKLGRELPPHYPKGRYHNDGQFHIGNISWSKDEKLTGKKYILKDTYLEEITV